MKQEDYDQWNDPQEFYSDDYFLSKKGVAITSGIFSRMLPESNLLLTIAYLISSVIFCYRPKEFQLISQIIASIVVNVLDLRLKAWVLGQYLT